MKTRTAFAALALLALVVALWMVFAPAEAQQQQQQQPAAPPIIVLEPSGGRLNFGVQSGDTLTPQQAGPPADGRLRKDFISPVLEFLYVGPGGGAAKQAKHVVIETADKAKRLDIVSAPVNIDDPTQGVRLTWTLTERSGGDETVTVLLPKDETNTGKVPAELYNFPFGEGATFKEIVRSEEVRSVQIKIP